MNKYAGKLLLFGEYTAIRGSRALALPLPLYEGGWAYAPTGGTSFPALSPFIDFLEKEQPAFAHQLDLARFIQDVARGLYFKSNIPMGYGAGSSGALCAAVYERYAFAPIAKDDHAHYPLLKKELAALEAYFHGSSSGTDPLICYLNQRVLLEPNGRIRLVPSADPDIREGRFFLVDTGIARKTAPLVNLFTDKCKEDAFVEQLYQSLIPANETAINTFLNGHRQALMEPLKAISAFQYTHFREMIPPAFLPLWESGLQSQHFLLKLCGAGGGGFLLGYSLQALDELPLGDYKAIELDI
jgi:mevalonate kinase